MSKPTSWRQFLPRISVAKWYRCPKCHGYYLGLGDMNMCPLCRVKLKSLDGEEDDS